MVWPQTSVDGPGITWLELAFDFHAAIHFALSMLGGCANSATAVQRARFFNYASRRLASICNCQLAPCAIITHCPILLCVTLGRATGVSGRPRLLCPSFVHSTFFLTVMEHNCQLGQNFKFLPIMPPYPHPLWNPHKPSHRLIGKRTPESFPAPTERRKVTSHKESIANGTWSPDGQALSDNAHDWRRKQQLQKI